MQSHHSPVATEERHEKQIVSAPIINSEYKKERKKKEEW
jgi:hypothetical protein